MTDSLRLYRGEGICTQNQLNEILEKVVQNSKKIFGNTINSVILFGSYARGDFEQESDIDVLVLADASTDSLPSYRQHIDSLCGELLWDYGIAVSVIEKDVATYKKYEGVLPFYKNIQKESVKIT